MAQVTRKCATIREPCNAQVRNHVHRTYMTTCMMVPVRAYICTMTMYLDVATHMPHMYTHTKLRACLHMHTHMCSYLWMHMCTHTHL